jgi:L-xylulose reductase
MDIRFDGKRVLVTGAGKGIGRDIAILLAQSGAQVIAVSRTLSDLESLAREIDCEIIAADLADVQAARDAAERAGRVDLLVNNAGITILQPFLETTMEALDEIMAVNLKAPLVISQVVARGMIERGAGGAIVNVSSQSSMVGLPDHTAYCASKGALDQLTRVMAIELGPHRIRVNSVNPVVTMTPMAEYAWSDPAKRNGMLARIPLGYFAKPMDVAHAVAYFLSEQADMIHGVCMRIDGGFSTM